MPVSGLCNPRGVLRQVPLLLPLAMFATSGLAFAAANILWARTLPVASYGVVALSVAVLTLAGRLAPFGADLEINRVGAVVTRASIARVVATSALTAVVAGGVVGYGYRLPWSIVVAIAVAVVTGGFTNYSAAALQARRRYLPSLALLHSINYWLLAIACVSSAGAPASVSTIVGAIAAGVVITSVFAAGGLAGALRTAGSSAGRSTFRGLLALLAITGSAELLTQLDRLVTPLMLSFDDLAHLGVLLALVGPPFRLLEMAVAYTMLPELRSASDAVQRRRTLRTTAALSGLVSGVAALLLLAFLTPLSNWLLGAKFTLPFSLTLAAVFAGLVRVAHGFAGAAATALVANETLPRLALLGLLSAAIGCSGAVVGARWGLEGIIYGSMSGWLFRTLASTKLVHSALSPGEHRC